MCLVTGERVRTELRRLILDEGMRRERDSMDRRGEVGKGRKEWRGMYRKSRVTWKNELTKKGDDYDIGD
jgi:hypothetical protein